MTQAEIAALDAKDVKRLRDEVLGEQESKRYDRRVEAVKKKGGGPEKQIAELLRASGATRHCSGALR